jgi:adenosylcobinamide-phosphate synthase
MTLLSIILALVIDQARPLAGERVEAWLSSWGGLLERHFNAGEHRHGAIAWMLGVAAPALVVLAAQTALAFWQPLLLLALNLGVLYLTTGFRQFSHYFTDIHLALRMGELDRARSLIAEWRGCSSDHLGSSDIARLSIELALVSSLRHVFAPLFWFTVAGPAGALLYRLSLSLNRQWMERRSDDLDDFGRFAAQAHAVLDWAPVRLTAVAFAIVGDFEDAVYCWRTQAQRWPDAASGILLSSGAGALGVRLGMPVGVGDAIGDRPELGLGDEADADFMQSTIGLLWRTLVMCLLLLALLWVASWVGS